LEKHLKAPMAAPLQSVPGSAAAGPTPWILQIGGKIINRLKGCYEPLWFVLSVALPLWVTTGRRPVLFSRYMALGDVICALPAVLELQKRHSGAPVIFHTREIYAGLLKMGGVGGRVVSQLNLHGVRTNYWFLFSGIYEFTYGDEFAESVSTEPVIAEFCRQQGVPVVQSHPKLQAPPDALVRARQLLDQAGFDRAGAVIAIHPGPSGPFREWSNESWTRLVQALREAGFPNIVQLGASGSSDAGAALRTPIPGVVSLVNQLSIEELVAMISGCDLLIGIDSGLLHIAASVGTPGIGLFGATSPALRFSPDLAHACVVSRVKCQGCHHRLPRLHWVTGCPLGFDCMKSISVEEVLRSCRSRLDNKFPTSKLPP
jgi:ADP-heptose:LPS heptosyltransferase